MKIRKPVQRIIDMLTFPLRAVTTFHEDRFGLSSLATERFDYVARETRGYCLDVGCGRHNRFIAEFLQGNGIGVDVFPYEGLRPEQIVTDLSRFPFEGESFDSITFIANINHIPAPDRDTELAEAFRCLKRGGNIVVTMGNPVAELLIHKVVWLWDKLFRTNVDMDSERGMKEDEAYFLTDAEIRTRLARAGFTRVTKKYFATQWGLNHLFVGWKPSLESAGKHLGAAA